MNDWQWQLESSISSSTELARTIDLDEEERQGLEQAAHQGLPFLVTPYYLSLIRPEDPADPIRAQCVPRIAESHDRIFTSSDPLAEAEHTVAPYLIRRYPDRVLLIATDRCATYCRHCTRRRRVGYGAVRSFEELAPAFSWLAQHREVPEIIVSGGDPLVAPDSWLRALLDHLCGLAHLEVIRIGSRVPVTLPQRITPELCRILTRTKPIYLLTHFNHPRELTPVAVSACEALARAGVILANQAVLLRGINDCTRVQLELNRALLRARIRPYYLMQCDAVNGTAHFRTSIARGVGIMQSLQGELSGLAIPTYVLDLPGGYGKVPLAAGALVSTAAEGTLVITGPRGELARYPADPDESGRCAACQCRLIPRFDCK